MDYRDRHVVVTGGTGALGTAVVGALLEAGAVCHVPYRSESEAKRFPHADNKKVSLVTRTDRAHADLRAFPALPPPDQRARGWSGRSRSVVSTGTTSVIS
jgi:NAD(P)-dependent dehydrogenase (short-subunit alcohol dehydrogenase family)